MPSCVADRYSSRSDVTFFAAKAFLFPSSINWSIRELRTLMIENSVATKKAVKAIKIMTKAKLNMSNSEGCN